MARKRADQHATAVNPGPIFRFPEACRFRRDVGMIPPLQTFMLHSFVVTIDRAFRIDSGSIVS